MASGGSVSSRLQLASMWYPFSPEHEYDERMEVMKTRMRKLKARAQAPDAHAAEGGESDDDDGSDEDGHAGACE